MDRKIRIFLCDLVHNYVGAATYMFPLNVGYLAAYANKFLSDKVEIKIFKYPGDMLKSLEEATPDIIGFSNYVWNADLNTKMSELVKSEHPETIIVFGGPNINYTPEGITKFFVTHDSVDFYIPFQGETPFLNLVTKALHCNMDAAKLKAEPIDGVYFYDKVNEKPVLGDVLPRIKNPDEIPSPYLTGVLDGFFDTNLIPIIETNRGCPYQCTFCCQALSAHRQIDFFSMDRVKQELDYVAKRVKNTNLLNLADSNFGIVERDFDIAKYISELCKQTGYPHKVSTNMAKNQPKIFEISKILNNVNLVVSLQSLDDAVLKNIKRSNIDTSVFKSVVERVNESGGISGTEIILGLPGETKRSHIDCLETLFDWDVSYIICYNALILEGSELSVSRERGDFKCKTKFRLIDSSFGNYNGILSFETEEGIRSTDTMTEDEILFFRPVHWLIQFLWNYRFYYDLLKLVKSFGINPLDYIVHLTENFKAGSNKVAQIFSEFNNEAKSEWFDSETELRDYYAKPKNFKSLEQGDYGKMNGKYIFNVLLDAREEFEDYLYDAAIGFSPTFSGTKGVFREIIDFLRASIIDVNELWGAIEREKTAVFHYDFIGWRKSKYLRRIEDFYNPNGFKFRFFITEEQEESLKTLLKQYAHPNKNLTLRKMSEYMPIGDLFYNVEIVKQNENKLEDGPNYGETKSAPTLKEIVINDPNKILLKHFGQRYADYRNMWKEASERKRVPDFPIHLDIDITDSCNLACEYCLQSTTRGWSGLNMERDVFIKILGEAEKEGACSINIGWNAEPIFSSKLFLEFLDILDKYDIMDVFVHTNAVNLPEDIQRRILSSKIKTMCFSLGAVDDTTRKDKIEKIRSSIVNFRRMRDALGKNTPIIRISIIPTEENSERIDGYVKFWKEYADYIEFQSLASLDKKAGGSFKKQLIECTDPWRRLSITSNGDIYPCCGFTCFSEGLKLGNVKDISLKTAWFSEKIQKLREELKSDKLSPGCMKCLDRLTSTT